MPNDSTIDVSHRAYVLGHWNRLVVLAAVLTMIGTFGYSTAMTATAEKRVPKVCAALAPGMSTADVIKFAESHGMYKPFYGSTLYFMGEKATSNNYGCRLEFKHGILQSSVYETEKMYEVEKHN